MIQLECTLPWLGPLAADFASGNASVLIPTEKGAVQSQTGQLTVLSFRAHNLPPQYVLTLTSPQVPPEAK